MYDYAIVGLGAAGLLTLAHLPAHATVLVLERGYIGGALATDYAHVTANIPTKTLAATLRRLPGCATALLPLLGEEGDACPFLHDLIKQLKALVAPRIKACAYRSTTVTRVQQVPEGWRIESEAGAWRATRLILCTGGTPLTMDLPLPHVPLSVALDATALARVVEKNEQVVVFGTAHSGTLVLKALRNVGVQRIVAVYRGASPFRFARDGDTEGIKQESAAIADEILAGGWADVLTLVPTSDVGGVQRALLGADAVVYSIGFRPSLSFPVLDEGGGRIEPAAIGACRVPGLFGFGIGFPSFYTAPNGKQYPDVGFAGFIDAIIASPLV